MATGSGAFSRLTAWSKTKGAELKVHRSGSERGWQWTISTEISVPVSFKAIGTAASTDEAAAQVIEQLGAVEGFEGSEPEPNPFAFA